MENDSTLRFSGCMIGMQVFGDEKHPRQLKSTIEASRNGDDLVMMRLSPGYGNVIKAGWRTAKALLLKALKFEALPCLSLWR
jgi:hypothetical protein